MKLFKYIFFSLFLGLMTMTSIQYCWLEVDGNSTLLLVEEEQEDSTVDTDIFELELFAQDAWLECDSKKSLEASYKSGDHCLKTYKAVYLSVPHSPPRLS